ncbi:MAG: tripartite tricarboxylate transporter substrate binding protein [Betaproteobacteria bacterium]|nr:tripartite tricarboxylate transporter substrate binding protein [Betaproteobacteria bacterium]
MSQILRVIVIAAAMAFLPLLASFAFSQPFPARLVRFIVPFPPGGGTDTVARIAGQKVSEAWGQSIVIENRPGAQGTIGTAIAAKAPPDGYTLILSYVGTFAMAPWMYKDLTYHPLNDFAHITQASSQPFLVVVHPSIPARSLKELAALAKARPGELSFASTGQAPQLAGELFKMITGTKILHVPYKGAGPAVIDLLAGNVVIMFANPISSVPHIKTGKLRGLAVTSSSRVPALPHVPTVKEVGYPDLEMSGWYGVSAPANTPKDVIARLNAEFVRALKRPDVKERLGNVGIDAVGTSSEDFAAYVKAEYERWGKVVKASGVTAE